MVKKVSMGICALIIISSQAFSATYYVNPEKGKDNGKGSKSSPWKTLAEVASSGKLRQLKGGDTVKLMSGNHGMVKIQGENKEPIIIEAAEGETPQLARLEIPSGRNWTVRGVTVSYSFAPQRYKGTMVELGGRRGVAKDIVFENSFIYDVLDNSQLSAKQWMELGGGISAGPESENITIRNNYVLNIRWGINLAAVKSLAEGNVVDNYSGDAFRVMKDDITVQYNVTKNAWVGPKDGDANHDDNIQVFLFNKGTGTVRNLTIRKNILISREDDNMKFPGEPQGIGFFDGPLVNFKVEDNVCLIDHWHGVSLFDAQNCTIKNNAAYSRWTKTSKLRPWVMLGSKLKQAHDNVVEDNMAFAFKLDADKNVKSKDNEAVNEKDFKKRYKSLLDEINKKFGEKHPLAKKERAKSKWN